MVGFLAMTQKLDHFVPFLFLENGQPLKNQTIVLFSNGYGLLKSGCQFVLISLSGIHMFTVFQFFATLFFPYKFFYMEFESI
jgi:hypothetical protein